MVADGCETFMGLAVPRAPDLPTLQRWGVDVGKRLQRPIVITFAGDLGAGKTTLVRAICDGLGVVPLEQVTSPTFALVQSYAAPGGTVTHCDLYRLRSAAELDQLGWDEIVAQASVLLIEWPERARDTLPAGTVAITLAHDPDGADRRLLRVALT